MECLSLEVDMDYKLEIQKLQQQLTGDMMADMEIKDRIHNLKMEMEGIKPQNSEIDCVGCGS